MTVGGEVVTDPARDVDESSGVALDGRPVAPEPHEVHALNKPAGVVSTARDTHGRPTVVAAGAFAAPALPGRAPRRRHHWPDPAHQRRRARRPADPPALRGEEGLPGAGSAGPAVAAGAPGAARRGRAGGRAYRARAGSPARARRAGADDPRGPQAPGAADGARPSATGWSSSSGSRSARSVSAASSRARAAASRRRRWSGCGAFRSRRRARRPDGRGAGKPRARSEARSLAPRAAASARQPKFLRAAHATAIRAASGAAGTIRRRMQLRALRGAITVETNEADAILSATEELMREVMERNAHRARPDGQLHLHLHERPRRRVPGRRGAPASGSRRCRCCAPARSTCRGPCRA